MTELTSQPPEAEIEFLLRQSFEKNYEFLRLETGTALAPEVRETALQHVLLYWRKMRDVALNITDTEVRLNLPAQTSPKGREFGIEGVVDMIRDNDRTVMYDIKTFDADLVRSQPDVYMRQLNVYAHIWQELRKQLLDGAGIICTDYPPSVKEALESRDDALLEQTLAEWHPLIEVDYDPNQIDQTVADFGDVVDAIEELRFSPPPLETLQGKLAESADRFATRVCRNCDARFSCDSYRKYARHGRGQAEKNFRNYYNELIASDGEENWLTSGLDVSDSATNLKSDFGN